MSDKKSDIPSAIYDLSHNIFVGSILFCAAMIISSLIVANASVEVHGGMVNHLRVSKKDRLNVDVFHDNVLRIAPTDLGFKVKLSSDEEFKIRSNVYHKNNTFYVDVKNVK